MKKIFLIGMKDVRLAFRDRAGLFLMLLAPFLLTIGMGFVTGRFSGSSGGGLSHIPLVVVNQDGEQLGNTLVEVMQSAELADLIEPMLLEDVQQARKQVDDDLTSAAVIIPAGFTQSFMESPEDASAPLALSTPLAQIEVYANPTRPTNVGVIESIVEEFIGRVEVGQIGSKLVVDEYVEYTAMLQSGSLGMDPGAIAALAQQTSERLVSREGASLIGVKKVSASEEDSSQVEFDVLAYMAPGMALMFLMYTVSYGGRTILIERTRGTLPRLLVSPTTTVQVLLGKVLGIFLTGVAQIAILIAASTVFFQVRWGDPLGTIVLVLAAVFGATGWGMLITAVGRSPGQVANIGSAIMLTFGILGGSFFNMSNLPVWLQRLSLITPNAWGINGFGILAMGGKLADLGGTLAGLLVMGVVLFGISSLLFNRQAIAQK